MPCETSIEGEPPKVWSHWWHSERWAQFAGRDPDDLTTTEIAQLIRLWNGVSLDTSFSSPSVYYTTITNCRDV